MRIFIAPDKFKGSLTALEVAQSIKKGIAVNYPKAVYDIQPMADGGDGSIDLLNQLWNLEKHELVVNDPLFRPLKTFYYSHKDVAFIEMSKASGLELLTLSERDCLKTTSLGTGELILDAFLNGFKKIKLFIGGSSTNDVGIGIASVLGYHFFDKDKNELSPIGDNISKIHSLEKTSLVNQIKEINIQVICDVNNPLYGINGAAHVYARQKGANDEIIEILDKGLVHINNIFIDHGMKDVSQLKGAGAAGGIGGGMVALFNAELISGIQLFCDLFEIEKKIKEADVVITGEGRIDEQSLQGKVINGVFDFCQIHKKKIIFICGQNEIKDTHLNILSIMDLANNKTLAMKKADLFLEQIGTSIIL